MPTVVATYDQTFKTLDEARKARDGELHTRDCLEFVLEDGDAVNLVPLETLPGDGVGGEAQQAPGAYRIERIEHIYTPFEARKKRPREARLTKVVALAKSLH